MMTVTDGNGISADQAVHVLALESMGKNIADLHNQLAIAQVQLRQSEQEKRSLNEALQTLQSVLGSQMEENERLRGPLESATSRNGTTPVDRGSNDDDSGS